MLTRSWRFTLLPLLVILGIALPAGSACASIADLQILNTSGSTKVKKATLRASRTPVSGTLTMPQAFVAGRPVRAELRLKFWNSRLRVSGGGGKFKAFQLFDRVRVFPGAKSFAWSCRPPEGTPIVGMYSGICDEQKYQTGGRDGTELPERGTSFENFSYDIAQPYFDNTYSSKPLKPKWIKKNRSVRYRFWVTFPRCLPLDATGAYIPTPAGVPWPCQPGSLRIGTTFTLRGKKGKRGWRADGEMSFRSDNGIYIYPPQIPQ